MAKLVDMAARNLNVWFDWEHIWQSAATGVIYDENNECIGCVWDIASDAYSGQVTRAQWEAERARIAEAKTAIEKRAEELSRWGMGVLINDVYYTSQQATAEALEIARTGSMTSEEQELADIACGKRSKEDQALWDKVASNIFTRACDESIASYRPEEVEYVAVRACTYADAFMAERAKRLKGV